VVAAVVAAGPDALVHELTSLPGALRPRAMRKQLAPTARLREEGTANLLAGAAEAGVGRIVAQSIAFAYAPRGPMVVDEDAPLWTDARREFAPTGAAVASLERQVTAAGGVVLRYGWFYGPGTSFARDGASAEMVRRRGFPIIGSGAGLYSFVHIRDAAEATVAALSIDGPAVLNVVDDDPAPVRDWLPEYARLLGAKPPRTAPAWLARMLAGGHAVAVMEGQRGASNARARERLGWAPAHPSWREGFAAELGG
jgi:nucleoside-diphosphate-sugar epimerase